MIIERTPTDRYGISLRTPSETDPLVRPRVASAGMIITCPRAIRVATWAVRGYVWRSSSAASCGPITASASGVAIRACVTSIGRTAEEFADQHPHSVGNSLGGRTVDDVALVDHLHR
jgi:hypothetical protein